jgi:hypothetical protein
MSDDDRRTVAETPPSEASDVAVSTSPEAVRPAGSRSWAAVGYVLFILIACAVPLAFALYTGNVWEDSLIGLRHCENLVEGKGLVYNPPDFVNSITSPLGVLLPSLCYLVSGSHSYLPALWWYRVSCILAFAGGGILVLRSLPRGQAGAKLEWVALALLYVVEPKSVIFATNGMETAFMLLFLGWALWLFRQGWAAHWLAVGVCWAGLMWTRPDSPLYILSLSIAVLTFGSECRRRTLVGLLKSALVCTIFYLPWFVGTALYYGTPVPQTVVAKANLEAGAWAHLAERLGDLPALYFVKAGMMFLPLYPAPGLEGWLAGAAPVALAVGAFAACYWLVPVQDPLGRFASLSFALVVLGMHFYMFIFPWYMPPVALLGTVAMVRGVFTLTRRVSATAAVRVSFVSVLGFLLLLALTTQRLLLLTQGAIQLQIQTEEIEMAHRAQIGLWLKEHSSPGDSVYLEPFGYIGYFSGLRVLDASGLVSAEIVQLRREHRYDLATLDSVVTDLHPKWMVLRPHEVPAGDKGMAFHRAYERVKVFDARPRLAEYAWIPGRAFLENDAVFHVFQRKQ